MLLACETCFAGATTLSVLKRVAPREFINHLWQAGRKVGKPSGKACPSCTQPLVELRPPEIEITPKIDLCLHCFLVWMERDTLRAVPLAGPLEHAARLLSGSLR